MSPVRAISCLSLTLVICATLGLSPAEAQRRSFGRPPETLTSFLRSNDVQGELKMSEKQVKKVEELNNKLRGDREFWSKLGQAPEEEREKMMRERTAQTESEVQKILGNDLFSAAKQKFVRKQQLRLQDAGVYALGGSTSRSLGLTEEQREKLRTAFDERRKASSAIKQLIDAEPDQAKKDAITAKFKAEWDPKAVAILTPDQQKKWNEMLGPPREAEPAQPAVAASGTAPSSATTPGATTTDPKIAVIPIPEGAVVVASFAPSKGDGKSAVAKPGVVKPPVPGTPNTPVKPVVGSPSEKRDFSFNFRYAQWAKVLPMFADQAGLTLDMEVVPPGTFNYYDDQSYTATEALDVLNGYLLQRGYLLIRRHRALVIVESDKIRPDQIPSVELSELPRRGNFELMRVIFPLAGQKTDEAAKEISELVGPYGKVVGLTRSNKLLVTDIGANLKRIKLHLDEPYNVEKEKEFRQFEIKNLAAEDVEVLIRDLFGLPARGVANVSAAAGGDSRSSRDPRSSFRPPWMSSSSSRSPFGSSRSSSSSSSSTPAAANTDKAEIKITVDVGTNSLLVLASSEDIARIEETIKAVDIEGAGGPDRRQSEPYLVVYELKKGDALEAAKTLNVLYPGTVVNEDGRNRMLHIMATAEQHREIATTIQLLDGGGTGMQVAVIRLAKMDALSAASTLDSLFIAEGTAAPTIQPDTLQRLLLIRASADQLTQIKLVLADMGEDGTGALPEGYERGPVRTLGLGGRDPEEVVRILERMWGTSNRNPIRIVIPSRTGPVREQSVPSQEGPTAPAASTQSNENTRTERPSNPAGTVPVFTISDRRVLAQADAPKAEPAAKAAPKADEPVAAPAAKAAPEPAPAKAPVTSGKSERPVMVTITGGEIVIASDDSDALDRMEDLILSIAESLPVKTEWTVFYLTSADATETATILERLFPTSSVASSSSGGLMGDLFGGGGGGLFDDLTGGLDSMLDGPESLKIIPETRSNALWVTGPSHLIREMQDVLKILDASELPHQLRDRVPHPIVVEYADVQEVYEIVKDLYKDDMEPPRQSRTQGGNPIAAMFGGGGSRGGRSSGGSRGGGAPAKQIKLTLSMDTRTNTLWVGANESLFTQVEGLVKSLDKSALDAKRTVRIVNLKNANSGIVQNALTSLMPKVVISTSSSGRRPSSSKSGQSASPQQGGAQSNPAANDAMRRMFEQRMRERMQQQQGGGGRPSSGGDRGGRPSFGGGRPSFGGRGR